MAPGQCLWPPPRRVVGRPVGGCETRQVSWRSAVLAFVRPNKLVFANFTRRKRSPQKAEMYLQGALKNYLAEGWALPVTHTRKQLAECQKHLGQMEKYPLRLVLS